MQFEQVHLARVRSDLPLDVELRSHLWVKLYLELVQSGLLADLTARLPAFAAIYVAYRSHEDFNTGEARPSVDRIMRETGVGKSSVYEAQKLFVEYRLASRVRRRRRSDPSDPDGSEWVFHQPGKWLIPPRQKEGIPRRRKEPAATSVRAETGPPLISPQRKVLSKEEREVREQEQETEAGSCSTPSAAQAVFRSEPKTEREPVAAPVMGRQTSRITNRDSLEPPPVPEDVQPNELFKEFYEKVQAKRGRQEQTPR